MFQSITIKKQGNFNLIKMEIKFYLSVPLFDLISGPILEKRLKVMIVETLKKIDNEIKKNNAKKGILRKSEIITK